MKITTKQFSCIVCGLLVTVINFLIVATDISAVHSGWELRCAVTTVILIIYTLFVWKVMGYKFYDPTFFVAFSLYMFHLSSVTVIGFDFGTQYDYIQMLYRYGSDYGFLGTLYSELFIEAYLIGVVLFKKKESSFADNGVADIGELKICRQIGFLFLGISFFPELYHDALQVVAKAAGGYQNMMEADTSFYGIPLGWFTKLFLPSILLILSGYRNKKKTYTWITVIAAVYFLLFMFLTGRKGNTVQTLVPLLFMYCVFFKPKFRLIYIPAVYFGALLITVVTHTRELAFDASFINSLSKVVSESEPIKDMCLEMGGTVKAPIQAILSVPATGSFQFGRSYLASIVYSILKGIKVPCEGLAKYALFNEYLSLPERGSFINSTVAAMGGSAIAEWYWNFGWLGLIFVIFIFAGLIVKYEKKLTRMIENPINFAVGVSFLYYLMRYTRGYFEELIWQPIYIIAAIWIAKKVLIRENRKERKRG